MIKSLPWPFLNLYITATHKRQLRQRWIKYLSPLKEVITQHKSLHPQVPHPHILPLKLWAFMYVRNPQTLGPSRSIPGLLLMSISHVDCSHSVSIAPMSYLNSFCGRDWEDIVVKALAMRVWGLRLRSSESMYRPSGNGIVAWEGRGEIPQSKIAREMSCGFDWEILAQ